MKGTDARKIGLARALSKLGYCSRSQASQLIRDGRVQLNAAVRRDPETPVRIDQDRIAVDGRLIEGGQKIYLMMNKPRGLVTTASDEKGRDTVYSLLAKDGEPLPWIAPVGRLDKASEGLLLLTNDSEWGARVSAPETHLEKTYHVQIAAVAEDQLIQALMRGVRTEDGDTLRAKNAPAALGREELLARDNARRRQESTDSPHAAGARHRYPALGESLNWSS